MVYTVVGCANNCTKIQYDVQIVKKDMPERVFLHNYCMSYCFFAQKTLFLSMIFAYIIWPTFTRYLQPSLFDFVHLSIWESSWKLLIKMLSVVPLSLR